MNHNDERDHAEEAANSHWDEHEDYPVSDWKYEVANDETRLGYEAWRYNQIILDNEVRAITKEG